MIIKKSFLTLLLSFFLLGLSNPVLGEHPTEYKQGYVLKVLGFCPSVEKMREAAEAAIREVTTARGVFSKVCIYLSEPVQVRLVKKEYEITASDNEVYEVWLVLMPVTQYLEIPVWVPFSKPKPIEA